MKAIVQVQLCIDSCLIRSAMAGVIHFAQNLGCKEAQFIASFPHRDPGTQTTASTFFKLPLSVIRATTGLTNQEIKKIQLSVAANPNPSLDKECAKRCGIKYWWPKWCASVSYTKIQVYVNRPQPLPRPITTNKTSREWQVPCWC